MGKIEICEKYCIGCGLCQSELGAEMTQNNKGFRKPSLLKNAETENFLKNVCPVMGCQTGYLEPPAVWGRYLNVYSGYAGNPEIRKQASSGGMLTALAIYLLVSGRVDAVIQVRKKNGSPTETECCICSTPEEEAQCCGSRYAISSPWMDLERRIQDGKKYAAIGKPCDIAALRNLKKNLGKYENILYLLSFFCAGLPSADANDRLISSLGCEKDKCRELTYRGNGWPGKTTATDDSGNKYRMEYSSAWGGILGRDIHPYCRLCIDGIGEAADVACGDGWYITHQGEVDFSERDGRNVVFSRTEKGEELLQAAAESGAVVLSPWENVDDLRIIQKYQFTRRVTMREKIAAHRMFLKAAPLYSSRILKAYGQKADRKLKFRVFAGTVKRIVKNKL